MKIAFIGLGRMGSAMARNLLRAGHEVTVYNRTQEKAKALAGDGAHVAESPAAACSGCEAAITMLANDEALQETVFGEQGIAAGLGKRGIHISASTISTSLARRLEAEHETRGQTLVSAPVFGRPEAAEAKRLIVITAGEEDALNQCSPLFDAMGRKTYVVGSEPWQANAVKLCGNFMIASMLESFGETFAVMKKSGIVHHLFFEIMNELFNSPVYQNYGGAIANGKFEPAGFALKLGLKDVRLVLDAAQECNAPMPFASVIRDHLLSAMAHGQAEMDWSSLALVPERDAGL